MSLYDIEVTSIDGKPLKLEEYRGKVLLVVNVASQCAFTKQYAGLEELYRRFKDKGLIVLGFPCNQFGWQEPGDEAAIKSFCSLKYNVSFPMFRKIEVNGKNSHPLYRQLKTSRRGTLWTSFIKWNFTKFLIDREGSVVKRYGPSAGPEKIGRDLVAMGLV